VRSGIPVVTAGRMSSALSLVRHLRSAAPWTQDCGEETRCGQGERWGSSTDGALKDVAIG
jgi:hypothetical protein